jgi:RNA polymerase sigma-70 factor, ECF subfamily
MEQGDRQALEAWLREQAGRGDLAAVATRGLATYGAEILGYMAAAGEEVDVDEAFAAFAAALWSALPRFRWDSSFRVWAYGIARRVALASRRRARAAARRAAPTAALAEVMARVRSTTAPFLRTTVRAELSRLRAALGEEERALLILRVDREMAWIEIARVFAAEDEAPDEAELRRRATTLRKRFERLKARLAEQLRGATAGEAARARGDGAALRSPRR